MQIALNRDAIEALQNEDARGLRAFLTRLDNAQKSTQKAQANALEGPRHIRYNLFIDEELHTQLVLVARQEDRSIQRQIIHILKQAINEK